MRRLLALSCAAGVLVPNVACAQEVGGGAGLFLAVIFGGGKTDLGFGAEAFGTVLLQGSFANCENRRAGAGPLFQMTVSKRSRRLVIGAHVGSELDPGGFHLSGELGLSLRQETKAWMPGFAGGAVGGAPYLAVFARGFDEGSFGVGARLPGTYGGECPAPADVVGRPLRSATGIVTLPAAERCSEPATGALTEVSEAWAADAQTECASVPAFVQLAHELMELGAPDHLVSAALDAAEEEIGHALLCAELASHYGAVRLRPVLPEFVLRPGLSGEHGLRRLALEAWIDGCLGEGLAAERAQLAARHAMEPRARAAQATIAREERAHAELGWKILSFALSRGDSALRDLLRSVRDVPAPAGQPHSPADLRRYGRVGAADTERSADGLHARAARRLDALLCA